MSENSELECKQDHIIQKPSYESQITSLNDRIQHLEKMLCGEREESQRQAKITGKYRVALLTLLDQV